MPRIQATSVRRTLSRAQRDSVQLLGASTQQTTSQPEPTPTRPIREAARPQIEASLARRMAVQARRELLQARREAAEVQREVLQARREAAEVQREALIQADQARREVVQARRVVSVAAVHASRAYREVLFEADPVQSQSTRFRRTLSRGRRDSVQLVRPSTQQTTSQPEPTPTRPRREAARAQIEASQARQELAARIRMQDHDDWLDLRTQFQAYRLSVFHPQDENFRLLTVQFDEPVTVGIDPRDLKHLPKKLITEAQVKDGLKCCVCLEDFAVRTYAGLLSCQHYYHMNCIKQWLRSNLSCPLCRHEADPNVWKQKYNR